MPDDLVDEAVFLGLDRGQVAVALGVLGDPLDRLAGVLGEDLVDVLLAVEDLLGLDLDVGDLAADLAVGLVDHDLGVRQREPPALGPAGQQHRGAGGGHADAVGRDRAVDELHRVVDGQRAGDAAAGAVDVEADPLGPVLELEEQELHHRQVGDGVVDHAFEEDDPVLQEQVAQGHLPLPGVVAVALERRRGERVVRHHGDGPSGSRPGPPRPVIGRDDRARCSVEARRESCGTARRSVGSGQPLRARARCGRLGRLRCVGARLRPCVGRRSPSGRASRPPVPRRAGLPRT